MWKLNRRTFIHAPACFLLYLFFLFNIPLATHALPQHAFLRGCLEEERNEFFFFYFLVCTENFSDWKIETDTISARVTDFVRRSFFACLKTIGKKRRNPTTPKLCRFLQILVLMRTFVRFAGVFAFDHTHSYYWLSQGHHGTVSLKTQSSVSHFYTVSVSREDDYHLCFKPRELQGTTTRTELSFSNSFERQSFHAVLLKSFSCAVSQKD